MKKEPLITILSPCYNVESYLPQCLDSIINQTYKNLQIVLIDDGSNDNTWIVMRDYASKDSRIEIYHQENQGVAATRNNLLDKVKGDYVLFVDSDDWIELDMVEFLIQKSIESRIDIVVCGNVINDTQVKEEFRQELWNQEYVIKKFLLHRELNGSLCNKLVKTSLLLGLRFEPNISYGEDALFFWAVIQKAQNMLFTDRQLYHYRMNGDSISHNSFGIKKHSGYHVWSMISNSVEELWPQYQELVHGHFAMSMTILLRDAAHSNYKKDERIRKMQTIAKKYGWYIQKHHMSSWKMYLYSFIGSRCYTALKYMP